MTAPNPSRKALAHLARLCRSLESPSQRPQAPARRALCTHAQSSRTKARSQQPSKPSNTFLHHRTFTSTQPNKVQPSPTQETDPQNTSNPTLPDITNYYTLFPSTLPDGPPGPGPLAQQTSSPPPSTSTSSPQFTIHLPTLRKEFLHLQSQHHPDKFPTNTPSHQQSLALSALINTAYKTLSDPLLRAQYLLQLQYDIDVMNEDNAAHPTDQETLMEVMEAQERVEEASGQEEVDAIKGENEQRMVETTKVMGEAFERGDVEAAKNECVRLKYWRSLHGALDEWEPGKEVRLVH